MSSYNSVLSFQEGLPDGFMMRPFSESDVLQNTVEQLLRKLQESRDGSQWIILVALTSATVERLADTENPMEGLTYRVQWDGSAALIKVVAGHTHLMVTDELTRAIEHRISVMHNPPIHKWNGHAAYRPTTTNGKQADQSFLPLSRWSTTSQAWGFPTLVVETGVPQSLLRLRANAKWWFANTNGEVRIVLIVIVSRAGFRIEKWQLAPPGLARPLSEGDIHALRQQNPPIPPLFEQPAAVQQAYAAQEIEVTEERIVGGPLVIPFVALFGQFPTPGQQDIVLGAEGFRFRG
ncbi:unnamed protein product [Penicillium salamii]|nr:unnamed protein product [Penicillium salamii]CAG8230192.1 unnamed protein product [Penicillium salamii]CAG8413459.1 unnamed protein product [Penicillium salamii]